MTPETFNLKTMGWLRADFKQKFGTPRQGALAKSSRAHVELAPEWKGRGILSGLEGFSHVWILSYLHLSVSKRQRGKIHPPRLKGGKVGILASRSPHRPNNIGLTLARVERCAGDELYVSEVDLVDGTPILDIKPYLALADRPEQYSCGWTDKVAITHRTCVFSEKADEDLRQLERSAKIREVPRVRALIEEMLTLDPRPPAYLGRADAQFAVWVAGLNVHFRFHEEKFTVTGVEPA
ncbi:MAG: tRNA (N6-threonylcarbamoyladenosine(37)-N6)-methyltransferase TrmO [Bdellovibrionales bacterium]|nr:tRNA (N6-threonylcarbamoyladenosine(37)-N6)-methyltransferase TrmO [Bdellovibrionales bacterium]